MTIVYTIRYTKTIEEIEKLILREEQKKDRDIIWKAFFETQTQLTAMEDFESISNRRPVLSRQELIEKKPTKLKNKLKDITSISFLPHFFKKTSGYSKQYDAHKRVKQVEQAQIQSLQKALNSLTQQINETAIAKQIKRLEEQKKTIRFQSNLLLQRLAKVTIVSTEDALRTALINFLKTHTEYNRIQLNQELLKTKVIRLGRTLAFFQTFNRYSSDSISHILKDTMVLFPEILALKPNCANLLNQLNSAKSVVMIRTH